MVEFEMSQWGWESRHGGTPPELLVVVVTYNSERHIGRCLAALSGRQVTVVDNASRDRTREVIRKDYPDVQLIHLTRNVGLSAAFNIGWRRSPSSIVLLINPDVTVDDAGIEALKQRLAQSSDIGVLGPRLINDDGTLQATARTFPTLLTILARRTRLGDTPWGRARLAAYLSLPLGDGSTELDVDWVIGAAMMIPGSVLRHLDGLDPRFFLYCEDVDFCARAWRAGYRTVYFPDVTFTHEYQRASRNSWNLRNPSTRAHWHSFARLLLRYPRYFLGRPVQRPPCKGSSG